MVHLRGCTTSLLDIQVPVRRRRIINKSIVAHWLFAAMEREIELVSYRPICEFGQLRAPPGYGTCWPASQSFQPLAPPAMSHPGPKRPPEVEGVRWLWENAWNTVGDLDQLPFSHFQRNACELPLTAFNRERSGPSGASAAKVTMTRTCSLLAMQWLSGVGFLLSSCRDSDRWPLAAHQWGVGFRIVGKSYIQYKDAGGRSPDR